MLNKKCQPQELIHRKINTTSMVGKSNKLHHLWTEPIIGVKIVNDSNLVAT